MADTIELGDTARRAERRRSETAGSAADAARQVGNELLAALREGVAALADEQRLSAADQIAAIGDALHCSAESLAGNSELPLDRYTDDAAQYLCDLAQTVRERSWSQLADDIEGLAHAQPMAFAAAAVGIGLLAGRFLLSAAPSLPDAASAEMSPERLGGEPKDGWRENDGGIGRAGSGAAPADSGAIVENA